MPTANYDTKIQSTRRENLSNIITTIDPTETPIQANIAQIDVANPEGYEHHVDELAAASAAGVVDGVAFSTLADAVSTKVRLLSRCQIQAKGISITGRAEETDAAGFDSLISYELALRAEELKRDCEAAITTYRTPVASASAVVPLVAGIPTWIRTNIDFVTAGPTLSGKEPVVGTDGAVRATDESIFLDLLGGCYDSGGNPDMVSVGRAIKQKMSQYFFTANARIATQYQDQGRSPSSGLQVVGAVDYYVSDFGVLAIVPNRFQRSRDMLILDTTLWELGVFRGYEVRQMGLTGDSEEFMLTHDFTIVSRNEKGNATFMDLDVTAAMIA